MLMWHTSPRVPDPHSHWINYVSSLTILILTSQHTYISTLMLPQPRLGSVFTPHLNMLNVYTASNACKWPSTASLNPESLLISHQTIFETVKVWSKQQSQMSQNQNTESRIYFRFLFSKYLLHLWCCENTASASFLKFFFWIQSSHMCFWRFCVLYWPLFPPLNLINRTALTLKTVELYY